MAFFLTIALEIPAYPRWLKRDKTGSHKGHDREDVIIVKRVEDACHLRSVPQECYSSNAGIHLELFRLLPVCVTAILMNASARENKQYSITCKEQATRMSSYSIHDNATAAVT